jgi:hypothetical protein
LGGGGEVIEFPRHTLGSCPGEPQAAPPADAVVAYGDRAEHSWNGDHTRDNAYSRLRYPQMVLPWVVERILETAPPGADVDGWRY